MAFPEDNFLPENGNACEICGAELSNEIVIQEFADGSIARLCSECAAGAALPPEGDEFRFPDVTADGPEPNAESARAASGRTASPEELDAVEKTRELLTPVVDLITLQTEMQAALQRLAASLETFATGVISENIDKTATVENRLETLERELEQTRARLRHTEALLVASGAGAAATQPPAAEEAPGAAAAAGAAVIGDLDFTADATAETTMSETDEVQVAGAALAAAAALETATGDTEPELYSAADLDAESTLPPAPPLLVPPPVAPPAGPATAEHHSRPGFQLAEVQLAQKYFNDSQFTNRVRDVRKSLGKPQANLTKLIGAEPRALLTVAWGIIWYQYLIDLRRDVPSDDRVALHREGMDLDELTAIFKEKNSSIDDEGRLDASELEVKLLSDPSTLITELTVDEERALEDATEEIWDQKTAPEFKWDD